jgi:hypothetical protein
MLSLSAEGKRSCFLYVVIYHLCLCVLLLLLVFVVANHITVVITSQHIMDCIETTHLRCCHVLLRLLHETMRFGSLIIKFLNQRVDLMLVAHTDKLNMDICQVFFPQWDRMS